MFWPYLFSDVFYPLLTVGLGDDSLEEAGGGGTEWGIEGKQKREHPGVGIEWYALFSPPTSSGHLNPFKSGNTKLMTMHQFNRHLFI